MFPSIQDYCKKLTSEFDTIPAERRLLLEKIADYISLKYKQNTPVRLVYICTHNSRRSHFGQVWAHIAAKIYGLHRVETYSGGTEATSFNVNAINALKRIGFGVASDMDGDNPVYFLSYSENEKPIECFSKVYNHPKNPRNDFAAIMTCSDAEENCPFIPGVELRIGTTYEDPKAFDHTSIQDDKYDERCRQIALETFYTFSKVIPVIL